MSSILIENLQYRVQNNTLLRGIDLHISEKRVGIIGANGSGKSTLARMINGLNIPSHGRIEVLGLDTRKQTAELRRKVGFLFSDANNQIVMPTVIEDVEFSLKKSRLSREDRRARAQAYLKKCHLEGYESRSPYQLSGGEKQLLALASVLVREPEIIVADEPTTLLDLGNRLKIQGILRELPQQVIVVTHDLDFIRDFDRVLWVQQGKIHADGVPEEIIPRYEQAFRE